MEAALIDKGQEQEEAQDMNRKKSFFFFVVLIMKLKEVPSNRLSFSVNHRRIINTEQGKWEDQKFW